MLARDLCVAHLVIETFSRDSSAARPPLARNLRAARPAIDAFRATPTQKEPPPASLTAVAVMKREAAAYEPVFLAGAF